jgi:hypothetical protein
MSELFGYFNAATSEKPAFDPGMKALCPHCLHGLQTPVVTVSLMKPGDARSYFYRAHKDCHEIATTDDIQRFESTLIDSLPHNDQVER